jgi:AcrR family transcriptional regulator
MLQAGDPLPGGAPEGAGGDGGRLGRLAVFEQAVAELAARVEPVYRQADGWLERTRAGLTELLRFCDEQPETARKLVVESIAWGPEVLERRGELLDALAEAIDRVRVDVDALDIPSDGTAENLVGACVSLVHTRLLGEEGGSFTELAPALMSMIVHPYLGGEVAKHELEHTSKHADAKAVESKPERSLSLVREKSY